MKKIYRVITIMMFGLMLVGCGAKPASSDFNEEELKKASEEIINYFNNKQYEEIASRGDETMSAPGVAEKLKEVWDVVYDKLGEFKSITKVVIQDVNGEALVTSFTKYENGKVNFEISFNKEMQMTGVYIK
ncbi:MAG: DUF3887 domain-containing protein [Clostridium sp.]